MIASRILYGVMRSQLLPVAFCSSIRAGVLEIHYPKCPAVAVFYGDVVGVSPERRSGAPVGAPKYIQPTQGLTSHSSTFM
jgi:hypothetical protein